MSTRRKRTIDRLKLERDYLFEVKKKSIQRMLEDTVGIIFRSEHSIHVILRGSKEGLDLISHDHGENRAWYVFVLGGSSMDTRNFEKFIKQYRSEIVQTFSKRDVPSRMVMDAISEYIYTEMYATEAEKPVALEVILLEIYGETGRAWTIDYNGDYHLLGAEERLRVIGYTTTERKKQNLEERIRRKKLIECTPEEINRYLKMTTKSIGEEDGLLLWYTDYDCGKEDCEQCNKESNVAPKPTPDKKKTAKK